MAVYERGIDVSRYQGLVNWPAVAGAGIQFAMVRIGSSNGGAAYVDPYFQRNVQGAHDAGMKVGAYYFTYAKTREQVNTELETFLSALTGLRLEYPVFVDVESHQLTGLGRQLLTELVRYAMDILDQSGWLPGYYTYTAFAQQYLDTQALAAYTGTLLLVTHDRHLMNSLACPILYLEDGKAVIYPSYDALMGRAAPAPVAEKSSEPAKAGYGKEQRRRRAELRAKIKACEDEMEACGAREVELENEINSPEVYNDPQLLREKSDELSDLRFHQDELFAAWEAAVEEQEQYEQTAGGEE